MNSSLEYNDKNKNFTDSLPDRIAKHILHKIISGDYAQGDRIIEADIAEELQISHAPIREALYLLQVDGVVERIPRKGVRVCSFTPKEISDYVEALIQLLSLAIELCKEKWTPENTRQLKEFLLDAQMEKDEKNVFEYIHKVESLLHYLFVVADNNAFLRFFKEINFVTSVFSQEKWKVLSMEEFHESLSVAVELLETNEFDSSKEQFRKTLLYGGEALL